MSPRWRKVINDLLSNKTRTLLVLLSIAVGVSTIGMVMTSQMIVDQSLPEAYAAVKPASAQIYTLNTFSDGMVNSIAAMDEVDAAEGRRSLTVRFETEDGEWRNLELNAVSDYEEMDINVIEPETGAYPPPDQGVLIERASMDPSLGLSDLQIGDMLEIETPNGKKRQIRMAGTVYDMNQMPAFLTGTGFGYVSFETLSWLGEPEDYNILIFTVANDLLSYDYIDQVSTEIQDRMASSGVNAVFAFIPPPGEHPAQNFLNGFSIILGAVGLLSLVLSGFLIVNTLSAIMTQQVRQIGIMKSIGARVDQVTWLYLVMVLLFGLLSLLIAIPLGAIGGAALSSMFAGFLNFDVGGLQFFPRVMLIQTVISLLAPLLAAAIPILRGVRVTVREAISDSGVGGGQFGTTGVDQFIVRLRRILPIQRPAQISLRNTFRRKARLALTLITLSLASAIFIAIFSIRASLLETLNEALEYFDYDVQVAFDRSYRIDKITGALAGIPEVEIVETWGFSSARRVRADDTEGDSIVVYAPRADSQMLNPILLEGRWIEDDDANAIVINTDVLRAEADIKLGDTITLNIGGREREFIIVGIVRGILTGANAFVSFDYFGRITNSVDQAQIALVRLYDRSDANQRVMGEVLENHYRDSGFRVQQTQTIAQLRQTIGNAFNVIIVFLLLMALLLGIVGGLGLMGTMSINVLERTREIGIMRAIGASNGSILQIVLLEGAVIGLISWVIGGILAYPAGALLTRTLGQTLLQSSPTYIFSVSGAILWLVIVLLLAVLASYLPARRASSLTVREVLSYE
ncbi:MAG: FtsX-like permease family protein [Caldilineaceae bacterium]|nr:FtsX-like permease family protein [Caldilineaceae bacterium]